MGNYLTVVHEGLHRPMKKAQQRLKEGKLADDIPFECGSGGFLLFPVVITIEGIRKMAENLAIEAESKALPVGKLLRRGGQSSWSLVPCPADGFP